MSSGNGGQVAFAKIGSLYRDVNSVYIWSNFVSESLEHTLDELEEGSITGRRDAPPSHKGLDTWAGDVEIEPNPNALAFYLKWFHGTSASSTVTAAGSTGANSGNEAGKAQTYHKFTPRQDAFDLDTFLDPINVMVYRDVGSAWLLKGGVEHQLAFDISANQLVKVTASFMGRKADRIERVSAIRSLVSSGGKPWVWDMASVEISTTGIASAALAGRNKFESLKITMSLPVEGTAFLDGTKFYGEFSPSDFRRMNFEGTMSFRDQTDYDTFIAYENRRMRLTLLNVNSNHALGNVASLDGAAFLGYYGLRLHVPRMKFLSWSAPIGGPNRLTASFTAKAEYDETEGFMWIAEMNNVVGSTELNAQI
jgi:hypothetical protein